MHYEAKNVRHHLGFIILGQAKYQMTDYRLVEVEIELDREIVSTYDIIVSSAA